MKILYFIGWCFNITRWPWYQRRFIVYMTVMLVGTFAVHPSFIWLGVGLVALDFTAMMIVDAWNSFCREQKDIINKLKGDKSCD